MRRKGTFARGLPVAESYVRPGRRWLVIAFGLLGALLIAGLVGYELFVDSGRLLSGGPVASAHAGFENECESCHEPLSYQLTSLRDPGSHLSASSINGIFRASQ